MKQITVALLLVLVLCREARAEWVLAAYTGASHTFASDLRVRQSASSSDATFAGVSWAPHPLTQGAPYYGLRLSYFPSTQPRLGATLDYTHYKIYAETADVVAVHGTWNGAPLNTVAALASRVQHLEISHGVNLTSVNAQYRWGPDFGQGVWQLHAGAGLLVYLPHTEGTVDGTGVSGDYQYAGAGGQIFGGVEYGLWRHFGAIMEGKFDAGHLELDLDPNTRITTQVRTLHLIGGIAFHF
jgi:hypothetical protein